MADLNTYDEMPYPGTALAESHPAHLATVAWLCGLDTPDPAASRVLELGCATGANIIPMAAQYPNSRFVGVDLSERQVELARGRAQAMGLRNIDFLAGDLLALGPEIGEFDYIVAYGLFSWVDALRREYTLRLCRDRLTRKGLALISYNTWPGWHNRRIVRDLASFAAEGETTARGRMEAARRALALLEAGIEDQADPATTAEPPFGDLRFELQFLARRPDSAFYHEFLETENEPFYLRDFVSAAEAAGLAYVADSYVPSMFPSVFSTATSETLATLAKDRVSYEQYLDFLTDRTFRESILARGDAAAPSTPTPERLRTLWLRLTATSITEDEGGLLLQTPRGMTARCAGSGVRTALMRLLEARPNSLRCTDLASEGVQDETLAGLFDLFLAGGVALSRWPDAWTAKPGERPLAFEPARRSAAAGFPATSLLHQDFPLNGFTDALLGLLDGTRDVSALKRDLRTLIPPGVEVASEQDLEDAIREGIAQFTRAGLIVA
jgi:SAM-dependent methyltransferase